MSDDQFFDDLEKFCNSPIPREVELERRLEEYRSEEEKSGDREEEGYYYETVDEDDDRSEPTVMIEVVVGDNRRRDATRKAMYPYSTLMAEVRREAMGSNYHSAPLVLRMLAPLPPHVCPIELRDETVRDYMLRCNYHLDTMVLQLIHIVVHLRHVCPPPVAQHPLQEKLSIAAEFLRRKVMNESPSMSKEDEARVEYGALCARYGYTELSREHQWAEQRYAWNPANISL